MRTLRLVAVAAVGAVVGCLNAGAFACAEGSCNAGGEEGICQPNGHCSYPDPDCPSGQSYADAGSLSGQCVDPESTTSGGTDTDTGSGTATDGTTGDPSTTDPTTDATGGGTTDTTTGVTGSTGGSTGTPAACGDGTVDPGELCPGMPTTVGTATEPIQVLAADLDGDDAPDAIVLDRGADAVLTLLNDGAGALQPPVSYAAGPTLQHAELFDANGDANVDLVLIRRGTPAHLDVLLGAGDGTFTAGESLELTGTPVRVAVADLDGDGDDDAVATDNAAGTFALRVWRASANGLVEDAPVALTDEPFDLVLGQFGGNPRPDAVVSFPTANLLGIADGGASALGVPATQAAAGGPAALFGADFDADTRDDVAAALQTAGEAELWMGLGGGGLQAGGSEPVAGPQEVRAADMDADDTLDVVVSQPGSDQITVVLGGGDGTFTAAEVVAAAGAGASVVAPDLNQDGAADLVATSTTSAAVVVVLMEP